MAQVPFGWHVTQPDLPRLSYLSPSKLSTVLPAPIDFYARYYENYEEPETPAKRFGKILHKALLEPWKFMEGYAIMPEFKGEGSRSEKKEWLEAHSDRIVLKADEVEQITNMVNALTKHKYAGPLLSRGQREMTGYVMHPEFNRPTIFRPDIIDPEAGRIVEIKTCAKDLANPGRFESEISKWKYDLKATMNFDCANAIEPVFKHYIMIAVEKTYPHKISMPLFNIDRLEHGRAKARDAFRVLERCEQTNRWPHYNDDKVWEPKIPYWDQHEQELIRESEEELENE